MISKGLDTKLGEYARAFLGGIGETAKGVAPNDSVIRQLNKGAYDVGSKFWNNKVVNPVVKVTATGAAGYHAAKAWDEGDLEGGLKNIARDFGVAWAVKHGGGALLKKFSPAAGGVILNFLSKGETDPHPLYELMKHADDSHSGIQKLNRSVESLFKVGGQQIFNVEKTPKMREKLHEFLEDGGYEQKIQQSMYDQNGAPAAEESQGFAKGGKVEKKPKNMGGALQDDHALATHYPEQDMLLNAARGRVSNYLNALRPQPNQPKLAFDDAPDNRQQMKSYHRALDMANQPLSILDKIKSGTLEPEHVTHFNNLYPEVGSVLQKKLARQISEAQIKGEKPSRRVRQSLSLFMGAPLSSELSPQNMMAAQAVFAPKQQPQGGAPGTKTSALKTSDDSHLTANQAAAARQQKQG